MPTITETIPTDRGMDNRPGGAYFASNMRRSVRGGVLADYRLNNVAVQTSGAVTEWLLRITKWVQREYATDITIFGRTETNGDIVLLDKTGTKIIRAMDYSQTPGAARGLAIDTKNELVYTGSRYLGRTVTSTLDGQLTAGASTIDVVDATGFPTAGYVVIKSGTIASETCQYTGKTTNQLTGVTRGKFNTTDATHATGLEIIAFDDDWKDLGASDTADLRPVFRSEDYVLAGNGNKVAGFALADGSDWDTSLLDLPTGFKIVDFSEIITGGGLRVLVAANKENRAAIFVWDKADTTWEREIPVPENIKKLNGGLVGLESGIWKTEGYGLKLVKPLPDDEKDVRGADFEIYDMQVKESYLLVTANNGQYNRNRTGLWILDLETGEWFYCQPSHYGTYGTLFGAIFISSTWRMLVSNDYGGGSVDLFTTDSMARGNYYQIVHDPQGSKNRTLTKVKLRLLTSLKQYLNNANLDFQVVVRYYDFKRPFLQYSQLSAAGADASEMKISDALGKPEVGDRVEIIKRHHPTLADVAAAPRNVDTVTESGGNFVLALDDPLPATIDATTAAQSLDLLINPLKKIGKITVDALALDLIDVELDVKDMPDYQKIMIEVEIRNDDTNISIGLSEIELTSEITD